MTSQKMELVFRFILFLAGLVNVLPAALAFLPQRIAKAYGIEVPDVNYELLLRHRAVLFGLVGGLMIYSALTKKHYEVASLIGLVSMISFIVLYFLMGRGVNAELRKVMQIDIGGTIVLAIGLVLYWWKVAQ